MVKSIKAEQTKDMTAEQKKQWEGQHDFDYIVTIWNGGEHIRAATLAAEAEFSDSKLDDLSVLCPGIKEHMPAGPGEVRQQGTVPGDPVRDEMNRFQVDESEVTSLQEQREEAHDADAVRAKREEKPAGKPDNNGQDGITLTPERQPFGGKGDHDNDGKVGGAKKPVDNANTNDKK